MSQKWAMTCSVCWDDECDLFGSLGGFPGTSSYSDARLGSNKTLGECRSWALDRVHWVQATTEQQPEQVNTKQKFVVTLLCMFLPLICTCCRPHHMFHLRKWSSILCREINSNSTSQMLLSNKALVFTLALLHTQVQSQMLRDQRNLWNGE